MAVVKFKISHAKLPGHVLHDHEDGKALRLRITTSYGIRELTLTEGTVIQTEDPLVIAQLKNYAPPRVPKFLRKPKGAKKTVNMMYDHGKHKGVEHFSVVDNDEAHHIEL
jgi:hypothetical protein